MKNGLTRREFLEASAAALAVAALTGCQGKTPGPTTTEPSPSPTATPAAKPKILNMHMPLHRGDVGAQADPGCSAMYSSYFVNYCMFSALVRLNEKLEPEPDMAESWTISQDGTVYTFKLRKNLKWSDGTPITAADFEYSIKRNLNPKLYCGGQYWQLVDIKGARPYYTGETTDENTIQVKALDDLTLEVTLENPAAYFINVATLPAFMALPRKSIEAGGEKWVRPEYAVYSGPFKCVKWITDLRMEFEPNPYYHFGKVAIDKFVLHMIQNAATALAAYEVGELDVVDVPETEYLRVKNDEKLSKELVTTPELGVMHLVWRWGVKATSDPRVRQAFACAIDKETLCEKIIPGVGTPAYQFLAPGLLGYDPSIGIELKYNPDKARKLLADGGFPGGKDFPMMFFNYAAGNVMYQTMFEALQAMILDVLNIKVELVPGEQTAQGIKLKDYPDNPLLWRQFWGADYPDPHNFMAILYTCPPPQAEAWKDPEKVLCNKKFDELVWAAAKELDPKKRAELYRQCEYELVVNNPMVIPLFYTTRHRLIKPYVKGLLINGNGAPLLRENIRIEG